MCVPDDFNKWVEEQKAAVAAAALTLQADRTAATAQVLLTASN